MVAVQNVKSALAALAVRNLTSNECSRTQRLSCKSVKRIRFSAHIRQKGIYALNITVSNDRYGTVMVLGLPHELPQVSD